MEGWIDLNGHKKNKTKKKNMQDLLSFKECGRKRSQAPFDQRYGKHWEEAQTLDEDKSWPRDDGRAARHAREKSKTCRFLT